jgi:acetyltransferase-like isoleucine patch superfamily enzyme
MNSIILKGTKIGKRCVVGAGSVVHGTFPDDVIIAGNPAKIVKYIKNE